MTDQLLDRKGIPARQADKLRIAKRYLVQPVLKLPILVQPEDDAALVVFRQRSRKALVQIQAHFFCIHGNLLQEQLQFFNLEFVFF